MEGMARSKSKVARLRKEIFDCELDLNGDRYIRLRQNREFTRELSQAHYEKVFSYLARGSSVFNLECVSFSCGLNAIPFSRLNILLNTRYRRSIVLKAKSIFLNELILSSWSCKVLCSPTVAFLRQMKKVLNYSIWFYPCSRKKYREKFDDADQEMLISLFWRSYSSNRVQGCIFYKHEQQNSIISNCVSIMRLQTDYLLARDS